MNKPGKSQKQEAQASNLRSLKIGVYHFYTEHQATKAYNSTQHLEWVDLGPGSFAEQWKKSVDAGCDYTLVQFQNRSNQQYLDTALKDIASGGLQSDVVLFTSAEKNKVRDELYTGFKIAEHTAPALLIANRIFQNACDFGKENSKYGILYGIEKAARTWTNIATDNADKTVLQNIPKLRDKARLSWNWYKPTNFGKAPWKTIFVLLSLVCLILLTRLSQNAGISGDEFTQYEWADTAIIPYYTDGKDAALTDAKKLMYLYGSSFDTFTAVVARMVDIDDIYGMRHFWNAVFGFICMFFGALIIKRLTGSYMWGALGLLLLFLTPRLLGDAYNNPKDIPFAAGYVIAVYYALKYYQNHSRKALSAAIGLTLGITLAISIRIGGLVLLPIVAVIAGVYYIQEIGLKNFLGFRWKGFKKLFVGFIAISVASYFLGILFWPYGIEDPFVNPFKALQEFTNFSASIRQLFEGKLYDSDALPRYYLVKYLAITLPVVVLAGLMLFVSMGLRKKNAASTAAWLVLFAAAFPVFYIWLQKSNVYGGLRQILFVVPLLVATATYGFYLLHKLFASQNWSKYLAPIIMIGGTAPCAIHIVKNHPLEYIYFNEFAGGVAGAYGSYEMDYYLAGLRPSTEWFLENVARKNKDKHYVVLTYGMDQVAYYCRHDTNVKVGFTRYDERSEKKWDYAIFYNAYLDKERLLHGQFPPVGTVFTPQIDGKPMGLVIQRPSLSDYKGFQADRNKDYRAAVSHYQDYLKVDSKSNEVYLYLAYAYANLKNLDSAVWAAKESVKLYPEFTKGLFALNQFYLDKNDPNNALKVMDQYIQARPKDPDAYLMKAQTLARKGDLNAAIQNVHEAIMLNPYDGRNYQFGAQLYSALKDNLSASQYNDAANMFNAKDATTYEKGLEAMKGIYEGLTGQELNTDRLK